MTQAILFTALVPVALAMVLAFALISDRLGERARSRVEWAMILTLYPIFILHWGSQAWERQQDADWPGFAIYLVIAGIFAVQFALSLRSGVLFPKFRNPKG